MANTKKYVSLDKLSLYDEKIKKVIADGDAAALDSAKAYADSLSANYEAAGSIATAQAAIQKNIDAVEAKADAAQAAADAAQGEVDALETYIGTIPTTAEAENIVEYINEKTTGIATDAALSELTGRVAQNETDIAGIVADYLKEADKTALNDLITAEAGRADTAEKVIDAKVEAIKADYLKEADKTALQDNIDAVAEDVADIVDDYLKAADKTELQGNIDTKVAQADYDAKMEEIDGDIDDLQTQINTIMNNPETADVIDSINEFTQYIADHGEIAEGFRTDIDKNKTDISDMDTAYKAADEAIKGRLDILEAINHNAYVDADTTLKNELTAEISKKADSTALAAAVEALENADAGQVERIAALEAKFGGEDGSVEDQIADAKQEAIDSAVATAADDATAKANAAESAAKGYTDAEIDKVEEAIAGLEAASATHALAADLGALTARVATAEGEIDTLQTEMDAVEDLAAANETAIGNNAAAIALKADKTALEAVSGRVTDLENWHANFIEVSEEEINALFA